MNNKNSNLRPWLQFYPPGVPAEIDADAYSSVIDLFEHSCAEFREHVAYSNFGRKLTYGELDELSRDFAAYLQGSLSLKRGDRVGIMMPNCLQYPVALFGALRAGMTVVNINPMYTVRELEHQLRDSGATTLVALDTCGTVVQRAMLKSGVKHVIISRLGDLLTPIRRLTINFVMKHVKRLAPDYHIPGAIGFTAALAEGRSRPLANVTIHSDDVAFLQYTGGTTGISMGAMLTHRNVIANMQQVSTWIEKANLQPGREIAVTALPLYHVYALMTHAFIIMRIGGMNHLITDPRDITGLVKSIKDIRFSIILGVNTLYNGLLNAPHFHRVDFSELKFCFSGGAATQRAVAKRWENVTGHKIVEGYGLTEASPVVAVNWLGTEAFTGTVGQPLPSTEVRIVDPVGGIIGPGQVGELFVRGPQVMKGYWNRPEDTSAAFADGWLRTGDMAAMDDQGFIRIVDRKKDMIIVSGFNVYPNEIEDVLAAVPGVKEVAVVGIPDERSGERVKAFIVRSNTSLTQATINAYAKERLTGYKRPSEVEFCENLPKSNVGKVLRRELRG
ncbi:AMP-binding protein [Stenotrophomonas maltophilia]|uniref:AMP-binding protein n=1 Tax=Stenotrophomonas maltophilia TaxID=40324 RepID=UPI000B51E0E1|nr:AMP-binding protein [Stenotrophomonas maltophilia]ASE51762.1 long-chain-fatty-acid--CoA ligase [Stenotrophomonas maltophilia]MCF3473266.1 AMP-binding protein [Stenotrophomonas maltophilia]MCF3505186.1 AMP-binding protein [Stenotrophomonas maltophilia]MCR1534598.1 AMP-binding protein [Stenotrophomonas maltophilia]MCR1535122.1 AMP-binding protein [Stenotrophomonas maltophilia]